MIQKLIFIILCLFILTVGCITKFNPDIKENASLLVVDGIITDQREIYTIKLSLSQPLGQKSAATPVVGATVNVSDNTGSTYYMSETSPGSYTSDSSVFRGEIGRKYVLHVQTTSGGTPLHIYESFPMELKAVPQIDSVYWEKVVITERDPQTGRKLEGCQIYVDSHDSGEDCQYYRWGFSETWEFRIPYDVANRTCWITDNSSSINLKSTAMLSDNSIHDNPVYFVSNTSDRLSVKYSINVKQYSLSQDEYTYWEKLKSITQEVGSLYDMIPASVNGNMICIDDPAESVLGYFSVSAVSTKRLFVQKYFSGLVDLYADCLANADTIQGNGPIPDLGSYTWVIIEHIMPPFRVVTHNRSCGDCTARGSNIRPSFWDDDQKVKK